MMNKLVKCLETVNQANRRSAWARGVAFYTEELMENLGGHIPENREDLEKALLNGARDWSQYSWGGCSLIYDGDIAEVLCNPSEYKKTRGGERRPNRNEEWLDVQARALYQAANRIAKAFRLAQREG